MTDKQLKRLNRRQLLELLLILTEKNEQLQQQLEALQAKLEEKNTHIAQAGTMAEAHMKLSRVFEAADAAAAGYLEDIRSRSERTRQLEEETNQKAAALLEETQRKCQELERATTAYCQKILYNTRQESQKRG